HSCAGNSATDCSARLGSRYQIRVRRSRKAPAPGGRICQLFAFGWRGQIVVEGGEARGRRKTVLCGGNVVAAHREPRPDAANRAVRLQGDARRTEPRDAPVARGRGGDTSARRAGPGVECGTIGGFFGPPPRYPIQSAAERKVFASGPGRNSPGRLPAKRR